MQLPKGKHPIGLDAKLDAGPRRISTKPYLLAQASNWKRVGLYPGRIGKALATYLAGLQAYNGAQWETAMVVSVVFLLLVIPVGIGQFSLKKPSRTRWNRIPKGEPIFIGMRFMVTAKGSCRQLCPSFTSTITYNSFMSERRQEGERLCWTTPWDALANRLMQDVV